MFLFLFLIILCILMFFSYNYAKSLYLIFNIIEILNSLINKKIRNDILKNFIYKLNNINIDIDTINKDEEIICSYIKRIDNTSLFNYENYYNLYNILTINYNISKKSKFKEFKDTIFNFKKYYLSLSFNKLNISSYIKEDKEKLKEKEVGNISKYDIRKVKDIYFENLKKDFNLNKLQRESVNIRPEIYFNDSTDKIIKELNVISDSLFDDFLRKMYPDISNDEIAYKLTFSNNIEVLSNSLTALIIESIGDNFYSRIMCFFKIDVLFLFIKTQIVIKRFEKFIKENSIIEEEIKPTTEFLNPRVEYIKKFKALLIDLFMHQDLNIFINKINNLNLDFDNSDELLYDAIKEYSLLPIAFSKCFSINENYRTARMVKVTDENIKELNEFFEILNKTYTRNGLINLLADFNNTTFENVENLYSKTILPELIERKNSMIKGLSVSDGYTLNQLKYISNQNVSKNVLESPDVVKLRKIIEDNKNIKAEPYFNENGIDYFRGEVLIKHIPIEILEEDFESDIVKVDIPKTDNEIEKEVLINVLGEEIAKDILERPEDKRFYNLYAQTDKDVVNLAFSDKKENKKPEEIREDVLNRVNKYEPEFQDEIGNILKGNFQYTSKDVYQFNSKTFASEKDAIRYSAKMQYMYNKIKENKNKNRRK